MYQNGIYLHSRTSVKSKHGIIPFCNYTTNVFYDRWYIVKNLFSIEYLFSWGYQCQLCDGN